MNKLSVKKMFSGKVSIVLSLILVFSMISCFALSVQAKNNSSNGTGKKTEYTSSENEKPTEDTTDGTDEPTLPSLEDVFGDSEYRKAAIKVTIIVLVCILAVFIHILGFKSRKNDEKMIMQFIENLSKSIKSEEKIEFIAEDMGFSPDVSQAIDELVEEMNKHFQAYEDEVKRQKKIIDSREKVEEDKKDFFASAAHELKSPLQSVKGYAEGLKYGIVKGGRARQEYCNIIIQEADNMNNLVLTLLDISKYRQNMYGLIVEEPFSINKFVQSELNKLAPTFKEKGIDVENVISKRFMGLSDVEKISHVLKNYLNNAISHVNYYKKIVITCEERASCFRIGVFNTGDHIPEDAIENVWNSFFRVDKGRNRKEGRYGLGLSIVQTIQTTLGNDFGVDNVYGGVQFWFDVKKAGK